LEPGNVGHVQIENDADPRGRIEFLQKIAAGGKAADRESVTLQKFLGGVPHVIIVVYDIDNPIVMKRHLILPKHDG
jgi:hypothetical protein